MGNLKDIFTPSHIWMKFTVAVVFAVIITMSSVSYYRLQNQLDQIPEIMQEELERTVEVSSSAVANALWNYDLKGIQTVSDAIFKREEIGLVVVNDLNRGEIYRAQSEMDIFSEDYLYTLTKEVYVNDIHIGYIEIGYSSYPQIQAAYDRLRVRVSDAILQTSILVILIILISLTVTRPLKKLEIAVEEIAKGNYDKKIEVHSQDEVGRLAEKFNYMAGNIESANEELLQLNETLETQVSERTEQLYRTNEYLEQTLGEVEEAQAELIVKNDELEVAMENLKETRQELIETAKTSLTSQLVAGVAHEINTPVGVSLTTSSYLKQEVEKLVKDNQVGKLTRKKFNLYVDSIHEASQTIQRNLLHSASLIESFKQVAVDQTGHRKRRFNMAEYIDEVLDNLHSAFKRTQHEITVNCPDDIELDSYPGAYSQILTNLLMNTLDHGFKGIEAGHIVITVENAGKEIVLVYRDDGVGIPEESLPHIFQPFYSTAHGSGGSGLGLSVINNLVTSVLKGSISCTSVVGEGTTFIMRFPKNASEEGGVVSV